MTAKVLVLIEFKEILWNY